MNPNSNPTTPHYFNTNGLGHFRVRTDLLEELCFEQAMERSLPLSLKNYRRWINLSGFTEEEYPFGKITSEIDGEVRYTPTDRYILHTAIIPGEQQPTSLITDARQWSLACEGPGLFEFVMLRAVEFAVLQGFTPESAWEQLQVQRPKRPKRGLRRLISKWSIGYERKTGICTILSRNKKDSEMLYLAGHTGYNVPNF